MRFEIPLCKRCCFCVPLRYGLLVWSYLVLVPQALLLLAEIWSLVLMERRLYYYHWTKVLRTMIYITLLSANIVLIFLLIVASHKKSPKLLKIYSKCGLTAAGATFVCFLLDFMYNFAVEGISMFDEWPIILTTTLIQLIFVGLQLYILAMVRSEIIKLENNFGFEFRNIATELEKYYNEPNMVIMIDDQNDNEPKPKNKIDEEPN